MNNIIEFRPLFKTLVLSGAFIFTILNSLHADDDYYQYNQWNNQNDYRNASYNGYYDNASPKEVYNRQIRNGNWDYRNKWHYHSDAYLSGENQAQYYQRMHGHGHGGIGYDSDKDNQEMKVR